MNGIQLEFYPLGVIQKMSMNVFSIIKVLKNGGSIIEFDKAIKKHLDEHMGLPSRQSGIEPVSKKIMIWSNNKY